MSTKPDHTANQDEIVIYDSFYGLSSRCIPDGFECTASSQWTMDMKVKKNGLRETKDAHMHVYMFVCMCM